MSKTKVPITAEQEDRIVELFVSGKQTITSLGVYFNKNGDTIRELLKRRGVYTLKKPGWKIQEFAM